MCEFDCVVYLINCGHVNSDFDPVEMTKTSSMNRFHSIICDLPSSISCSSNYYVWIFLLDL